MWRKRKSSSPVIINSTDQHGRPETKQDIIVISSGDENDDNNPSSNLDEDEWYINCILDETESQYLIDWEGNWSPTWEPKENASDLAIQTWEDKKKQVSLEPSRSIEVEQIESSSPQPQSCDREGQDPKREDSPLFIPVDTVFETPQVEVASQISDRSFIEQSSEQSPEQSPEPARIGSIDSAAYFELTSPSPPPSDVFGYTSKLAIPAEYQLPEEIPDTCPTLNTPKSLREVSPVIDRQGPNSPSPPISDVFGLTPKFAIPAEYQLPEEIPNTCTTPNTTKSPREVSPVIDCQVPKSGRALASEPTRDSGRPNSTTFPANHTQEVDEIAETPSSPSTIPESQWSQIHADSKGSRSQRSIRTISYRSVVSTLVSQVHHSGDLSSTGGSTNFKSANSIPDYPDNRILSQESQHILQIISTTEVAVEAMDGEKDVQLTDTMDRFSEVDSTPREKMKNAYAQLTASLSTPVFQGNDASATPSSAGDIEPSTAAPMPETAAPLSVRVDKEHDGHTQTEATSAVPAPSVEEPGLEVPPQHDVQTIQPSALTVDHMEEILPGSVHLGPSEFAVTLPMDSRVKDDYERVLASDSQSISEFLKVSSSQDEAAENEVGRLKLKVHDVLKHLSNVATHPDLNISVHIKETGSDMTKEAAWAEYSSAKFLLLGYFVQLASSRDIHLVIFVHGEKTQTVVESYLIGKGLTYTRPREEMGPGTNLEVSMVKDSLSFGIQSLSSDGIMETYKRPSAIISLDSSFNAKSPSVEHMRTTFARNGQLLPVIRLIVANSSEHVELCFPSLDQIQQLRLVIQYTVHLRDLVGDLQDDALGVREDVEEIIPCLLSDNFNSHWSLPQVEPLHIVNPEQLVSLPVGSQGKTDAASASIAPATSQKRAFVEENEEQASKRLRADTSQDATQLTESSKFPSQTLDRDIQALEKNLLQMRTSNAAERQNLQASLDAVKSRLRAEEQAHAKLQHRYESQTRDARKTRKERDQLFEAKLAAEQRVEKQKGELVKLKDERTQLRHDLEKAREEIKAGGGNLAELESEREKVRRLTQENAALQRKAEQESKQTEYTREQYQNASSVAAQAGNESRQLREENEELRRKVAGDVTRLKELNQKSDAERHLSRIAELEATLLNRDDLLRRKEEELREIRKNRPSTRSTSTQPRSPKLAAGSRPTSPGVNNNYSTFSRASNLRFSSERPV
ncbi:uncharacterized protein KD926_000918 [Aspergillus affinis]|uniref:uncharacterized protein n=1 Tax=Aspergillus affinis TaxID=1070780 RepID=UPI0022FED686|nr:putative HDA1 complex subunit [Aspergillus affinis]KAI9037051.1 putative HDA1 complex subunit [Aspergillus affinis]